MQFYAVFAPVSYRTGQGFLQSIPSFTRNPVAINIDCNGNRAVTQLFAHIGRTLVRHEQGCGIGMAQIMRITDT